MHSKHPWFFLNGILLRTIYMWISRVSCVPKGRGVYIYRDNCIPVFIATLFIIAKL
jgi:hypothetical protein